jgi:hypothetical protein
MYQFSQELFSALRAKMISVLTEQAAITTRASCSNIANIIREESMSASGLTHTDESCLKTALAFCILRQRKKHKRSHDDTANVPFCNNLLSSTTLLLPSGSTHCSHVDKMLQVGVTTAKALYNGGQEAIIYDMGQQSTCIATLDRLNGVASHLAAQLISLSAHDNHEWISSWIQDSLIQYDALSICSLWHAISEVEPCVSDLLIGAIGKVFRAIYFDEVLLVGNHDPDLLVVNLLHLFESTIVLKLNKSSPHEMLEMVSIAIGSELSLPVDISDMAAFVLKTEGANLCAPSKLLLRLALHDLMVKISHL